MLFIISHVLRFCTKIHLGLNSRNYLGEGAGDTAVVVGYACNETESYMPLPITLAHSLSKKLADLRKTGRAPFLRPDGKALVTVAYEGTKPLFVKDIILFAQHDSDVSLEKLKEYLVEEVVKKVVPSRYISKETRILVNPFCGEFSLFLFSPYSQH